MAALAVAIATPAATASHSWGSYHWPRSSNPFTVNLGDNVSGAWDGILGEVAGDWSSSVVLDTPIVAGSTAAKACKASSGVQVCNAKYGYNGWLGLAQIWVSGSHIQKAVAKVNDSYFALSTYNRYEAKRHVLCQEVGHTLGLDHQTSQSCMDDKNGLFDASYMQPNGHDYEQLALIYGSHTDTTTTSSTSAKGNGKGNGETLFVQDLGNGRKLFTWVYWTEPGAAHGPPF